MTGTIKNRLNARSETNAKFLVETRPIEDPFASVFGLNGHSDTVVKYLAENFSKPAPV